MKILAFRANMTFRTCFRGLRRVFLQLGLQASNSCHHPAQWTVAVAGNLEDPSIRRT